MHPPWPISVYFLGLLASRVPTIAQGPNQKPNIIFILTDDQDKRMNSLDHMQKVQNLLIDQGTLYTRHYAPTALCCPARVSIWTGLHAHNHNVTDVGGPFGGWPQVLKGGLNSNYLPIWLRDAGYDAYYTGKLYNGMKADLVENKTARGWTKADLLVGGNTYQYYDPPFQHIEGDWDNPQKVHVFHNNYTTDKVANFTYGYLKDALAKDKPFFIGVAPITPHSQVGKNAGPPLPAHKYNNTRPDAKIPRAANFNPQNRSGVNINWMLNRLNGRQVKMLDMHYQRRTEALLSVDDLVEGVVNILQEAKQLDNTFIIYSSDNGFHLGHHRLGAGKKYAFEEDINVPLIIRGPGVPKNRTTDLVSAHVDFAPTILHMAGAPQRPDFDGQPIPYTAADITAKENDGADEHSNVEFWTGASYTIQGILGRQVNSYKSVRLAGKGYDIMYAVHCSNNSHELYDMQADPVQMRNLHPTAPAEEGQSNPYDSGTKQLAGYDIPRILTRIDALLLVLKSCKANVCSEPWKALHKDGSVKNLRDAMAATYDQKYESIPRVRYNRCFTNGTIDLKAEGPQWGSNGPSDAGLDEQDEMQTFTGFVTSNDPLDGWEGGYWDDWE